MEQDKIIERLRGEIGSTSLSDRTITEYVSLNLPEAGSEPDDAYFTKHAGVLKSLSGNLSHDVSLAVDDFKKKYKPTPNPNPNPVPAPEPEPKGLEEVLKALQGYQTKIEEMEKKLSESEKKSASKELMQQVKARMQEQGAKDAYVLEKTIAAADFGDETDVEKLTKTMLEKYDAEYTACRGNGSAPRVNRNDGNGGGASKEIDDFFKRKASREHWSKK
jgi:hypothetical protein